MKPTHFTFVYRTAVAHTVAYFIAGLFAVVFMNYKEHFSSDSLGLLMWPVDSPRVAMGPGLNLIRGILLGLILLPLRSLILGERGFLKLVLLITGLSYISTIGPTPGSFDGYIYTRLPLRYHLLGIPEMVLYVLLFAGTIKVWYNIEKRWFTLLATGSTVLILLMSLAGYLQSTGRLG